MWNVELRNWNLFSPLPYLYVIFKFHIMNTMFFLNKHKQNHTFLFYVI